MNRVWAIPIISSILILGTLGLSYDVFAVPLCGNGIVEGEEVGGFEECDDGTNNSDSLPDHCRSDCTFPACGDGVTDSGEQCDDGDNFANNFIPDSCRTTCTLPTCGDGVRDPGFGEECDDGNTVDGDGCSSCQYDAAGAECGDGTTLNETTNKCEPDVTQEDLDFCNDRLTTCDEDLTSCNSDLATCEGDLANTQADLVTAQNALTEALNQITAFFEILQSGEIDVCHNGKTKTVTLGGLGGHLTHGDTIGACE